MAFKSGKQCFGKLKDSSSQSSYISKKKAKNIFCSNNICSKQTLENIKINNNNKPYDFLNNNIYNYNNLYLYNKYILSKNIENINKTDLAINLIVKEDLEDVCVISAGFPEVPNEYGFYDDCSFSTIDFSSTIPYYISNTIDPRGLLFGNSPCNINDFTNYFVLNKVGCSKKNS